MAEAGRKNRARWFIAGGVAVLLVVLAAGAFLFTARSARVGVELPTPSAEAPERNASDAQPPQPAEAPAAAPARESPATPSPSLAPSERANEWDMSGHPRVAGATVRRYPNIEAPDRVPVGRPFSLQISLTMEPLSDAVQIQPGYGSSVDAEGRLSMTLPRREDGKPWPIDVVVTAPDFEIAHGNNRAMIDLPADGDSTPALFELTPRSPRATAKVWVTFWHAGTYLARASRVLAIDADDAEQTPSVSAQPAAAKPVVAENAVIATIGSEAGAGEAPADLTVYVQELRAGDRTVCQLTIESPYLQPGTAPCTPAAELQPWLAEQYNAILRASAAMRGVKLPGAAPAVTPEQAKAMLRGIGRELYRRAAGPLFDSAFWKLVDREKSGGFQFRTIQIYTNNPSLPWELMVPVHGQRSRDGFLGTEFEIARWHIADEVSSHDKPPRRLDLRQVVAIAPSYAGSTALAHQDDEIQAIHRLSGFRQVKGELASIQQLLRDPPDGIVHFAGHGVADRTPGGMVEYAIQLEGGASLDLMSWRGLMHDEARRHPLYFLNACDVGQANRVLNFVDGWAPAVLDGGASGFIGGLWPLSDKGAAAFATHFYRGLGDAVTGGQPASVAKLVTSSRGGFFETGDPTFLAYVFYGDVNLKLAR
jgi:hypothetical protein